MNRNLTALVLIIIGVGLYFTVTQNILADAKVIKASNQEYLTAIKNAENLIKVRDQILSDFNKLPIEDRAKLDKMVPKSIDNIRLIIDLNNIALRQGLALKDVRVSAGETGDSTGSPTEGSVVNNSTSIKSPVLKEATVAFGLTAPYQQFISFIQDLESSLRILDINKISVTSNDVGIYEWKVELQTYWLQNPI